MSKDHEKINVYERGSSSQASKNRLVPEPVNIRDGLNNRPV